MFIVPPLRGVSPWAEEERRRQISYLIEWKLRQYGVKLEERVGGVNAASTWTQNSALGATLPTEPSYIPKASFFYVIGEGRCALTLYGVDKQNGISILVF